MTRKHWPGDEPPPWAVEMLDEMRAIRRALEVRQQKLVTATEAARLLGISALQFRKLHPVPSTQIPGEVNPRYSVAKINALIEEWTAHGEKPAE